MPVLYATPAHSPVQYTTMIEIIANDRLGRKGAPDSLWSCLARVGSDIECAQSASNAPRSTRSATSKS